MATGKKNPSDSEIPKLIMGGKAFQRPFSEGLALIQAVQEIYLAAEVSIA